MWMIAVSVILMLGITPFFMSNAALSNKVHTEKASVIATALEEQQNAALAWCSSTTTCKVNASPAIAVNLTSYLSPGVASSEVMQQNWFQSYFDGQHVISYMTADPSTLKDTPLNGDIVAYLAKTSHSLAAGAYNSANQTVQGTSSVPIAVSLPPPSLNISNNAPMLLDNP